MPRSSAIRGIDPTLMAQVWRHLRNRDAQPHPPRPADRPRLQVLNHDADGEVEVRLYDAIGGWWGITATDIAELLDDIDGSQTIRLRVNSPGGDVFDGTAIYNLLRDHPATVNVVVDGLAASAASFIAQAGDSITMNRGTQMMIHDALGLTFGNAAVHREMVNLLDRVSDEIAGIYADRAGQDAAFWRDRMLDETWYNAAEAVEAGLADEQATAKADPAPAGDDEPADALAAARPAARLAWDLSAFAYAGRHQAPPPVLAPPEPAPAPVAAFDPAAFKAAMRGAIR